MTAHVWNPPTLQAVTDHLAASCLPPDYVMAEIQKRGLTLVPPPNHACEYYSHVVSRYRAMSHGYHTEGAPKIGAAKIYQVLSYWHDRPDDTTTRFSTFVDTSGILFHKMSDDGRSVYVVVPYSNAEHGPVDHSKVFCIGFHHLGQDYFSKLRAHACGAALSVLSPVLRHYGIFIVGEGAEYRAQRSLEGVTVSTVHNANRNSFLSEFIFGTSSLSLEYYSRSLENLFNYLATSPVMTPEALGLSADATTYVGDPALLEDPVFYGFLGYIVSNPQVRQVVSRHTKAVAEKALSRAQSVSGIRLMDEAHNQTEINLLREVLTQRVSQALDTKAVDPSTHGKVLTLLGVSSLTGKKMVEMVGAGPRTFEAFVDNLLSLYSTEEARKTVEKPIRKKAARKVSQVVLDKIDVDDTSDSGEDADEVVDDIPF